MVAARATSTFAKFFPVEVYPVAAPVALAAGLFTYMLTRVIVSDPDTRHSPNMPIDCLKSSNYGEQWRNSIRGYFHDRIKAGNITIFDREVAMQHFRPQA